MKALKETKLQDIIDIERLMIKTSFHPEDILLLKNLYIKYIDNKAVICTSCPGSLQHYVRNFQGMALGVIAKIRLTMKPKRKPRAKKKSK